MNYFQLDAVAVAGDVVTTFIVPDNFVYHILYGHAIVNTVATGVARRFKWEIKDTSDSILCDSHAGATQAAALTGRQYALKQGIFRETSFNDNDIEMPIPRESFIPGGHKIVVTLLNGIAGDSYDFHMATDKRNMSAF